MAWADPSLNIDELKIAFRDFAGSVPRCNSRERGGLVLAHENRLDFQELPNRSRPDNRYIAVVPAMHRLPGRLMGFWHTHPGSAIPSPIDLLELRRINRRFQRSFALCILGRRFCSITMMRWFALPYFRYYRSPQP